MNGDAATVLTATASFAATVLPIAAAWVSKELIALFRVQKNAAQQHMIVNAVDEAATLIINGLRAASPNNVPASQGADLMDGVAHVMQKHPDEVNDLGYSEATLANMIQARVAEKVHEGAPATPEAKAAMEARAAIARNQSPSVPRA